MGGGGIGEVPNMGYWEVPNMDGGGCQIWTVRCQIWSSRGGAKYGHWGSQGGAGSMAAREQRRREEGSGGGGAGFGCRPSQI
eukprot:4624623-Prymnesium_polylepis.1